MTVLPRPSDAAHPAPSRDSPDPSWYSREAVQACRDAWSVLAGRPSPRAAAAQRRTTIRTWVGMAVTLALLLPLMIWWAGSGDPDVSPRPPWPWWLPSAIQFAGLGLYVVGAIRDGSFGSDRVRRNPARGLGPDWRRRLRHAVDDRAALPGPWVPLARASARARGTVPDQVVQGIGWLLFAIGLTGTEFITPRLVDFGLALITFWVIVGALRIRQAYRGRRYLGRLS